jgi:hypothetical protein
LENKANYLKKRKKENEEQKIKKEERIKKFTLLRENSKIKIKKREDDLLILKKEIYNSVIGRRFSFSDKFLNKIISKGVIDFKTRMEDKKLSLNEKIFLSKILENYTFNKEFFQLIYLFLIFLIQKKSFKNFHLIVILFTFLKKKKLKYLYKNFDIFCLDDKNDTYLLDFNYLVEFREMYFKLFHNNFFYKRESFFNIFKILREGYNFKKTL